MPPSVGASSLSRPVKTICPAAAEGGAVEPNTAHGAFGIACPDQATATGAPVPVTSRQDTPVCPAPSTVELPLKAIRPPSNAAGDPGNWSNRTPAAPPAASEGTRNCGKPAITGRFDMPVTAAPPPGVA